MVEMKIDLEPLEEYLAMVVAYIIDTKESRKQAPANARIDEILSVVNGNVKEALNGLVRTKVLTYNRTLNGTSFMFTPPRQTNINQPRQ